jgi:hypothetical protein
MPSSSSLVTITRPADTTAYTANDVVGGAISFPALAWNGADFIITSATLAINIAAIPAGMTSFRAYLYNVTPPSALADNAAWDLPAGDRAAYIGYVDFGTPVDLGSTLYVQSDGVNAQLKAASNTVFAYLVTIGGFTPAASTVFTATLHSLQG